MKKIYLTLILVFSVGFFHSFRASAQKNLVDGYIITLKKDTLKGRIDYQEWNLNPTTIHFMDTKGKKSIYRPDDISGFLIPPNDHYIGSHVSMDLTSFRTKDLQEFKAPVSVKDTALFLQTVIQGKASLYYIKDRNNREHFYISKDGSAPLELLIKKSMMRAEEGKPMYHDYIATVELFKGQLIVLLDDCPALKSSINNSNYTYGSLYSLLIKYNACVNSTIGYSKKQEPVRFKFGLLAGPTLVRMKFKNGDFAITGVRMTDCFTYTAGLSLNIIFPRERAEWSLVNEVVYKAYSNKGSSSTKDVFFSSSINYFDFDMAYVKVNTMLRYQYPEWRVHPFVDLGMSNGFALKSENSQTTVTTELGRTTTTVTPAMPNWRKYEFGVIGGVGVTFWKVSGEFRYEWAEGFSPYAELSGFENTFAVVFSFTF